MRKAVALASLGIHALSVLGCYSIDSPYNHKTLNSKGKNMSIFSLPLLIIASVVAPSAPSITILLIASFFS